MKKRTTKRESAPANLGAEQAAMPDVPRDPGGAAAKQGSERAVNDALNDTLVWIREHRCRYEIQALVEVVEGRPCHVGYEVNLHAELPELPIGEKITKEVISRVDELRDRLGEILESLIPKDVEATIQIVPFRPSVRYPKGLGKNPVVTRTARVFPPNYANVNPGDRENFGPTEERLTEMGFTKA
jgi:hypothetical protein